MRQKNCFLIKGGESMTREQVFVEIVQKLSDLDKDGLEMINHVTDSFCVHQSVKKAIHENSIQQLQSLVAS